MTEKAKKDPRPKGAGAFFYSEDKQLYIARIELPPRNGVRRRKEITAKTRGALQAKLGGPLRQFDAAGDIPTASTRVEVFLGRWLDEIEEQVRPNTAAGYRSVIMNHVIPEIGNVRMGKLTPTHLRRVYTRITSTRKNPKDPKSPFLTSTYALNAHRVLSRAFKAAEREGVIPRNPCQLMDAPRKSVTTLQALTLDEAMQVIRLSVPELDGKTDVYDPTPIRWAFYLFTGARRGEVLGLEWDRVTDVIDFEWQLQRIKDITTVPADYQYRHVQGTMYLVPTKSQAGKRVVPLVNPLLAMLERHRDLMPPNRHGLVFTDKDGDPIDPDTETKQWQRVLAKSGITDKHVRLHDLRHTTVDLLLQAGVHEDVVMEIVGHSSRAVTRGYKSPHALERRNAAMRQLSSLLGHTETSV